MADVEIVRASVEELIPRPEVKYLDVHGLLKTALALTDPSKGIKPANLLWNSGHGLGKSLLAATFAEELGKRLKTAVPMVVVDCSEDTRDYHLRGSFVGQADGSTPFVLGPFPSAIELANEVGVCVLCAEEMSALTPGAQKQFNSMTDWRRGIYIPQLGRMFSLKEGCHVVVVGTMNPSVYSGTYSLADDLRSRMTEYRVPYPTKGQETKILKSVCSYADREDINRAIQIAAMGRTRQLEYKISTRDLVQLLENIAKLEDPVQPLVALANKFEDSHERETVADIVKSVWSVTLPKLE